MSRRRKNPDSTPPSKAPVPQPARGPGGIRAIAWIVLSLGVALAVLVPLVTRWWPTSSESPAVVAMETEPPAGFVGSETCRSCHAAQYADWSGSQHQRAMQRATAETVLGDFDDATFEYAGISSRFFRRDGAYVVRTDGPDGTPAEFNVKYTYGVYPLQQYLIEFPDGRIQALSIAWDTRPKRDGGQRWFHLYPKEKIDYRDELHWTKRTQNWNFMCADCHSTDVRKNYDAKADTFRTQWAEISVGCEACHGPGSRHVAWAANKGTDASRGLTVALDERRGISWPIDPVTGTAKRSAAKEAEREIAVCAQCHSRRAQIAEGYHAGRPFLDHYRPALLEPGLYHADGQQRDEVYIWGSFLQSRMHRAGVTCSDCHEPHGGKLRAEGNAVCGQCHLAAKFDAPSHHFHKAGVRCVDCHMPATTYMVLDPRRDHSLRVPRPELTLAYGVPNACATCHVDRPPQWAADAVHKWYGRDATGYQRFADALSARDLGTPAAGRKLAALAGEDEQPKVARATALQALAQYPTQAALAAIERGLRDAEPLLRTAAIAALAPMPPAKRVPLVAPLLTDPLLGVRIEAARSLAAAPRSAFTAEQLASFERAAAEFEQVHRYNADRPEARTMLATFYADRGRLPEAEAEFRAAQAMRPLYVPAFVNAADVLRVQGRDEDAEAVLSKALEAAPRDAVLHHAHGLTLVRLKRMQPAIEALERASNLAPDDARYAYVYAVALNSAGKARAALAVIDRALLKHPSNRDLLGAGAAFARDAGDASAAARYADRLAGLEVER